MKQTSKYFALILLTVTFSFIGAAVYASNVFAKTEIDANGIPRCLSPYEEACGSNCKRNVTCGPNGEFRVSACNCQAQNQPTCPVATIWDGSVCKGTAKGTNDETKDTTPSSGGGEKVANKEKKPADPKTRQEANKVTVGGSSGGGGQQPGSATPTPTVTVNPICLRTKDECLRENGGAWCGIIGDVTINRCFPLELAQTVNCTPSSQPLETASRIYEACGVSNAPIDTNINAALCRNVTNTYCMGTLEGVKKLLRDDLKNRINASVIVNSIGEGVCIISFDNSPFGNLPIGKCTDNGISLSEDTYGQQSSLMEVWNSIKDLIIQADANNTPKQNVPLVESATETESDDTASNTCEINCNDYCSGDGITVSTSKDEDGNTVCTFGKEDTNNRVDITMICKDGKVTETRYLGNQVYKSDYCEPLKNARILDLQLVKPVKAQSLPEVIDPNDLEAGVYIIEIEGYKTATVQVFADNMTLEFFNDLNGDGIRQDNEPLLKPELTTIKIEKVSSITLIDFTEGWNLISLNTVSNTMANASDLHTTINNQGIVVYQISKYDSGKWIHYVSRINEAGERVEYGQDFPLIPGEGYFVRAINEGTVSLEGQKIDDNVAFTLENGWNLVGIQSKEKYTAYGVLNRCSAQSIQCSTISRYTNGAYQSVVFENNMTFGQDYDIESTSGYFIKNQGAKGEFKP